MGQLGPRDPNHGLYDAIAARLRDPSGPEVPPPRRLPAPPRETPASAGLSPKAWPLLCESRERETLDVQDALTQSSVIFQDRIRLT